MNQSLCGAAWNNGDILTPKYFWANSKRYQSALWILNWTTIVLQIVICCLTNKKYLNSNIVNRLPFTVHRSLYSNSRNICFFSIHATYVSVHVFLCIWRDSACGINVVIQCWHLTSRHIMTIYLAKHKEMN